MEIVVLNKIVVLIVNAYYNPISFLFKNVTRLSGHTVNVTRTSEYTVNVTRTSEQHLCGGLQSLDL